MSRIVAENSLFSVLPEAARRSVVSCLHPQSIDDGAYLFHAEQAADRLYVVASGELEVVRVGEGGTVERLNLVGPGELVGELALLRGALRSASVRAHGRALVYWMHAADFAALVHRWPALAIEVAGRVADNFVVSERRWHARTRARVWCVHASLPFEFVEALISAAIGHLDLDAPRRVVLAAREPREPRDLGGFRVEAPTLPSEPVARQQRLEHEAEHSALVLVHDDGPELAMMLPGSDALLVGARAPRIEPPVSVRRLEITRTGLPTRDRIKARRDAPLSSVAPRVARTLLGRSVGLALGGGGALGYAHLGVLDVLEELGVGIDFVLGTSMGAIIGGAHLCVGSEALRRRMDELRRPLDWMTVVDPTVVTSGVLSGHRASRFLTDLLKLERFDELCTPFAAVALDIESGEECVIREGSIVDAVRASIAIPGVLMPHSYDGPFGPGARFVDGGMINNVPVDCVRAMGADRVIGVHVMGRAPRGPSDRGRSLLRRRLPGLGGLDRLHTAALTYVVALARSGERQVYMADVGLIPDTSGYSVYELWRGREIAQTGRRAAEKARDRLAVLAPRRLE
ncbi:patatin-like phospholipase family protein [Paraliomyxa miuraensis]|uniref:patatin-like phospholipase family protein n=1 Tax=Paraliomyxa miuraensis TaxID=376150 RepID=UPI0022527353|nr:cyclic nucleotide-binding and patatin-like phospholipase domain-containing protein [Paraliomyxa miuraensis]MCX4241674.1 patatin-like phospholipase domain-containing protein [Paraliomyxa miuraensis]